MATGLDILVNGELRSVQEAQTVTALLVDLGLGEKRVAVELNGVILPRSQHVNQQLQSGDRLEIVQAIGGG